MRDYIVVGAGSAGCVVAARLTEDAGARVLLLEAGGPDDSPLIHTPAMSAALQDSVYDWRYRTVPQRGCNMRRYFWPRGRTLGGSSSINYMIYMRGNRADYDGWRAAGCDGWGYDDVLPLFKRAEHNERLRDSFHGQGGPLNVADLRFRHPLSEMFVAAAQAAGIPANADFNGAQQAGCGFYQVTQKDGARWSAASAYLRPALPRPNLQVVTRALTTRIRIERGRATGVDYIHEGQMHTAQAAREVILCGGAINSPQLLLLSGIGPAAELERAGVKPVHDLPGVGKNLHDHFLTALRYEITSPVSLHGATPQMLAAAQQAFETQRAGPLTSNIAEAGAFVRMDGAAQAPEVQYIFLPYLVNDNYTEVFQPCQHGVTLALYVCRPRSRGQITLASPDPLDAPLIDPDYLSDPADAPLFVAGLRRGREMMTSGSFGEILGREWGPGIEAKSDQEIETYIRGRMSGTCYHPVGTCKMGVDKLAVVDPQLRVHGVAGLRVVDASIMPAVVSGNTNAPTIMIAEKAAGMIPQR